MPVHTITPPPPWGMLTQAHLSSVPVAIEGEHLPTEVSYDAQLRSGRDPDEDDKQADALP